MLLQALASGSGFTLPRRTFHLQECPIEYKLPHSLRATLEELSIRRFAPLSGGAFCRGGRATFRK